jgi:hypothetical protein
MAGIIYRVIPKQIFPFSASASWWIAKGIDISQYREATLLVRVHTGTVGLSASSTFTISVWADAPTTEDPTDVFFPTSAIAGASTTLDNSTTVPSLIAPISCGSANLPAMVRIKAAWSSSSGATQVVISADLVAKC